MLLFARNLFKSTHSNGLVSRGLKTAVDRNVVFSNGRVLNLSFGKLSKLADGSSVGKIGDTNVMVVAVSTNKLGTGNIIPLTVDYREKASAGGRIPTNHLRRDLAPTDREILSSRIIDRSIRNCFPAGYFYDTQVVCNVLSIDAVNDPDVIAVNAASTSLSLSNIPWNGPVGAVRVCLLNGELIVNPTKKEAMNSTFSLVVTSNAEGRVVMLEGCGSKPTNQQQVLEMIKLGVQENLAIVDAIQELKSAHGVPKRQVEKYLVASKELIDDACLLAKVRLKAIFSDTGLDKKARDEKLFQCRAETIEKLKESHPHEDGMLLSEAFFKCVKESYCEHVFETGIRCDGRAENEIRPLYSEYGLYRPLHGSALFQRGQTQVLATLTFDSPDSALRLNNYGFPDEVKEKNFMLHYEFPQYAVGDIGRIGFYGRREVGHGTLAERALKPIVPDKLPFVVRLSAEVLESNGSSSMASVCAGSLAMMDAGLDVEGHVGGIAIGLLNDAKNNQTKILTDILGFEDFAGEMDFKIAGPKTGLTALQLDCKMVDGLDCETLEKALQASEQARNSVIEHMNTTISMPNKDKSNLPVTKKFEVPAHRRSAFVGLNGYHLKRMKAEIGVSVFADGENSNSYTLFAPNSDAMQEAEQYIEERLSEVEEVDLEFGAIYDAKLVEIMEGGVMVKIKGQPLIYLPNKQLDKKIVRHASSLGLEVGSEIQVKFFGRDPVTGQVRLSRKALLL